MQEVITHVEFHPRRGDVFLFSSSKNYMSLCDLRESSQFSRCSLSFQVVEDPSRKHFFTDIINSISRAKFSPTNDTYIFSRDYLSVMIWDIRQNKNPVQTFNVTDYLDKKLCEVYESERIFDKFDLQVSPDSRMVLTGSYYSHAHVIDMQRRINTTIDVRFMDKRGKNTGVPRFYKNKRLQGSIMPSADSTKEDSKDGPKASKNDFGGRISMGTWHPKEQTFAVAKYNSLFIYSEKRS